MIFTFRTVLYDGLHTTIMLSNRGSLIDGDQEQQEVHLCSAHRRIRCELIDALMTAWRADFEGLGLFIRVQLTGPLLCTFTG